LTIPDAISANSFHQLPPGMLPDFVFGNAEDAFNKSSIKFENVISMTRQEPFHLENHVTISGFFYFIR
jgi:hypothetical protein